MHVWDEHNVVKNKFNNRDRKLLAILKHKGECHATVRSFPYYRFAQLKLKLLQNLLNNNMNASSLTITQKFQFRQFTCVYLYTFNIVCSNRINVAH